MSKNHNSSITLLVDLGKLLVDLGKLSTLLVKLHKAAARGRVLRAEAYAAFDGHAESVADRCAALRKRKALGAALGVKCFFFSLTYGTVGERTERAKRFRRERAA